MSGRFIFSFLAFAASTIASTSDTPISLFGRESNLSSRGLLPNEEPTFRVLTKRAPCSPGKYYTTRCKSCTAGYSCPDGQNRVSCGAGAYSAPDATQCTLCPYGTFSGKQNTKYVTGCTTVAPGHRANAPIGATAQLACGKGTYSNGATDTCTTCPAGSKCSSSVTSAPTQCEPGTYSNAGNGGSCTKCPKGTFNSINGATGCCSCCSGTFGDTTGATSCSSCPSGQGSAPGSRAASACSASNRNGVSSCNQSSGGTCPVTANTVAASGRARLVRRDASCVDPKDTECPIPGLQSTFECIDTEQDVESCGGCVGAGGVDCTGIPGASGVECEAGACVIKSCDQGFRPSRDRKSCQSSLRHL